MKLTLFFKNVTLLSILFFTTSCSSTKKPNKKINQSKVITLNFGDDPTSFDPRRVRDLASITLMKALYEGLTRVTPDQKIELGAAEKYEISEDLKTYTFHLRPSKWTNGQEVTAENFEKAWKKALDPSFPCDNAFQMYVIQNAKEAKEGRVSTDEIGVKAIDKYTLRVDLKNPTPYFLQMITHPVFFPLPTSNFTAINSQEQAEVLATNGPFILKKWISNDYLEVVKNPTYWDNNEVKLDGIKFVMVLPETELMMYEKGEVDWTGSPLSSISLDAMKDLEKKYSLHRQDFLSTYFLRVNVANFPLDQVKLRKALNLAIKREEIVKHVLQGGQTTATSLVPAIMGLSQKDYFQDGDIQTAKTLFSEVCDELGVDVESFPEISLTYIGVGRSRLISQALQQQWEQAFGIRVKLEAVENKIYFSKLSKKDYELICCDWVADFDDPINFLEVFKYKTSDSNNTNWGNSEYTRLLDESAKIVDTQKRKEILAESEAILMNELPIMPIFYASMRYLKNENITDVVLSSLGSLDFKWADLQGEKENAAKNVEFSNL